MRVTRIIKDYVTRMVKEIYSEPTEEEKAYSALKETLQTEVNKINEKFKPMIEKDIEAFNTVYGLDKRNGGIKFNDTYLCTFDTYDLWCGTEVGKKAKEAERTRIAKRNEAIENIILTLELGGNRADLDRMLNELKENK